MTNNTIILHLSLISGIGAAAIMRLVQHFAADLAFLYKYTVHDLVITGLCTRAQAERLVAGLKNKHDLDHELALIAKHKIAWTTYIDQAYPELLKHIYLPPPVLYWQGASLHAQAPHIAFVGSRQANTYAQRVIAELIPPLIEQGWVIVSGGARGADSMAHEQALQHGGITIAVLGSGLLQLYPEDNKKLFYSIIERNGTIVSTYPLRTRAQAGNFPARNRVIAGLSKGCIVIQAAAKSGALITAQYALDQGKELFVVPGSIFDELSAGCHALLKQGAHIICSAQDILEVCVESAPAVVCKESAQYMPAITTTLEQKILAALSHPLSIDELEACTAIKQEELQIALFELQLEGRLQQNFVGLWERNDRLSQ